MINYLQRNQALMIQGYKPIRNYLALYLADFSRQITIVQLFISRLSCLFGYSNPCAHHAFLLAHVEMIFGHY